jgi:LuxR family transcriptional regulator, maltose regulon positive regulatory protein
MFRETWLQTKLIPPRLQHQTLLRPRLLKALRESLDYRITIVQASTGYGKSTVLAQLAQQDIPFFWYSVTESDRDPQQFLAHLIAAFQLRLPTLGEIPLAFLREPQPQAVQSTADALINALGASIVKPALLIVDDYHFAACPPVNALADYLIRFLPRDLHTIVSTRGAPQWEHLASWRAHSQVLEIHRGDLAFTREEVEMLFRDKYRVPLAPRDLELLVEKTEGWSTALQLVGQELRAKPQTEVAALLASPESPRGSVEALFTYLARDVLAQLPRELQEWVLQTSILRELDDAVCAALTGVDSQAILEELRERDLFLVMLGDHRYRYQYLFHDFLRTAAWQQDQAAVLGRHRRAAEFFRAAGDLDEAIYHLLRAQEFQEAIPLIEQAGDHILQSGRLETLASWIEALPVETVTTRPLLLFDRGELARLRSRMDEALGWYSQAEGLWRAANDHAGVARARRGQACVYLDTMRAPEAELLLQQALQLDDYADPETQTHLLNMLAENKLNMGRTDQAEQLRQEAAAQREDVPTQDTLSVRVKIRTGRLDEAREILETWARQERGQLHTPRAHRETSLLLALIYAAQGRADDAMASAQEGIALGVQLDSPFISATGEVRLGHAYQLRGELQVSLDCYERAIVAGDRIGIPRVRADALAGMVRSHGLLGDLEAAAGDAAEGVELGRQAGDPWIVAQVQLALGASAVLAHQETKGIQALVEALIGFHTCRDTFGSTAVWMWLALAHWHMNQKERALTFLDEALSGAQPNHYDYLLTTRTLLGWQDPCVVVPLLIETRRREKRAAYAARLLAAMGLDRDPDCGGARHPGYQLRMQTLGPFRVWRGETLVLQSEWQRKKARQLLQLLVTQRQRMIGREEIFELLWRDEAPDAAARDFKVALNALNRVLEPEREPDDPPAFILREETAYHLSRGVDVWIDADEFAQLIARAASTQDLSQAFDLYRRALVLYQDDFLRMDAPYEDWALAERERLQTLYLNTMDRLATGLLERNAPEECQAWCKQILARDRCWEHAYRLMMSAYIAQGNLVQARRVFDDCTRVLREDLGIAPSPATVQIYNQLIAS